MTAEYIIVQAGGRGSRLGHLTENKPKALVPYDNLPLLFHLFHKFPDKRFIIIGDYKKRVLQEYLSCFSKVQYQMVEAFGNGTLAGVGEALRRIPAKRPFMLIWSDLVLGSGFTLPEQEDECCLIGISKDFVCRWSFDGQFKEKPSARNGVAGLFLFSDKAMIMDAPKEGEFVRYLKTKKLKYLPLDLNGTKELGCLEELEKEPAPKCRPFNKLYEQDGKIIKAALDQQGENLARRERRWYEEAVKMGVKNIPKIYGYSPLIMERINGKNVYEYGLAPLENKKNILKKIIRSLQALHGLKRCEADSFSVYEAYVNKTWARLKTVRDLIPFADNRIIRINGRECRNLFFYRQDLERLVFKRPVGQFCFIHGDPTFSNILMDQDTDPILIDPRGYFGYTELAGDEDYDWAKLYYSIKGNYDSFNLKRFRLQFVGKEVKLGIESNHWEDLEPYFWELLGERVCAEKIKLLHAVIWLSLTSYAWQDYDSVCAAFYNGLYYLEEVLG